MRGTKQRLAAGLALVLPMLSAWTASGTPYIEPPEYTVPSKEVPWGIAEAINVAKFNEPYPLKGIEFRLTGYFDPTYSRASFQNNEDEPASFTIQMSFDLNATFPYSGGADEVMTVTPTFSEGEALAAYAPPRTTSRWTASPIARTPRPPWWLSAIALTKPTSPALEPWPSRLMCLTSTTTSSNPMARKLTIHTVSGPTPLFRFVTTSPNPPA